MDDDPGGDAGRGGRLSDRVAELEALIDRLDDWALSKIHGGARYKGDTVDWQDGASHGARHVACDVRSMIRAGDPELDERAIRRAALAAEKTDSP